MSDVEDPAARLVDRDRALGVDFVQRFGQLQQPLLANPALKVHPPLVQGVEQSAFARRVHAEALLEGFDDRRRVVPAGRADERHVDHYAVELGVSRDLDETLDERLLVRRAPRAPSLEGLAGRRLLPPLGMLDEQGVERAVGVDVA